MKNRYLVPALLAFAMLGLAGSVHAQTSPTCLGTVIQCAPSQISLVLSSNAPNAAKIASIRDILASVPAASRLNVAAQAYRNSNSSGLVAAAAQQAGVDTVQMASISGTLPATAAIGDTGTNGDGLAGDTGASDRDRRPLINGTPASAT